MHKIPVLFQRRDNIVVPIINPAVEWVLHEPTIAHRKYDGVCMLYDNEWYVRTVVPLDQRPQFFHEIYQCNEKCYGWLSVEHTTYIDAWQEALASKPLDCDILDMRNAVYEPGTYELIGPSIKDNAESLPKHRLMPHNNAEQLGDIQSLEIDLMHSVDDVYAALKRVLFYLPVEGVVFKNMSMQKNGQIAPQRF